MLGENISLVNYTRAQEKANCLTHAFGIIMGVFALMFCAYRSLGAHSVRVTAAAVIYGLSMIVLFGASAVYHGLPSGNAKKIARVLDHSMVFLLIAGTATPCALVTLYHVSPFHCRLVFSIGWICAALGILSALFFFEKSKAIRMCLLIGEGTVMISSVLPIADRLNMQGFALLWVGCGVFLVGAILFGIGKNKPVFHTVFHVFVLVGVAVHLYSIATYVFEF